MISMVYLAVRKTLLPILAVLLILQSGAAGLTFCICFAGNVEVGGPVDTCCSEEHRPTEYALYSTVKIEKCVDCIGINIPADLQEAAPSFLVGKVSAMPAQPILLASALSPLPAVKSSPPPLTNDVRPIASITSRVVVIRV